MDKMMTSLFLGTLPLLLIAASCDQELPQPKEGKKVEEIFPKKEETKSEVSLLSETLGNFIGQTLKNPNNGVVVDLGKLVKGIQNGFEGIPAPLSEEEYERMVAETQKSNFEILSQNNLDAANQFMKENLLKKSVVVVEPGKLHYEVLHKGKETPIVDEHCVPSIHYKGKLIDGTTFGSSEETGPVSISLERAIPGFKKGILGMSEGEGRRLYIHPSLAYGTKGDLPPNSLLIFDVAVVDANAADEQALKPLSIHLNEQNDEKSTEEDEVQRGEDLSLQEIATDKLSQLIQENEPTNGLEGAKVRVLE